MMGSIMTSLYTYLGVNGVTQFSFFSRVIDREIRRTCHRNALFGGWKTIFYSCNELENVKQFLTNKIIINLLWRICSCYALKSTKSFQATRLHVLQGVRPEKGVTYVYIYRAMIRVISICSYKLKHIGTYNRL